MNPRACPNTKFCAKTVILKSRTKNAVFWGSFVCNFEKLSSYLKLQSSNLPKCNVLYKTNKQTKFEPEITFTSISNLNLKKLLLYLRSTPSNLPKCNISSKKEKHQIRDHK